MKENRISLANLIVGFLLHWRSILVTIFVGMLLMGTIGYVQSVTKREEQIVQIEEAKKEIAIWTEMSQSGITLTPADSVEIKGLRTLIEKGVTITPGVSLKDVVMGAVMSLVLYVCIYVLYVVYNPYISIEDDLEAIYDIPQIGVIAEEQRSVKKAKRIDEAILNLKNRIDKRPVGVKALNIVYVYIKLVAQKKGYDRVCLVGCEMKEHSVYVCEQLKKALEKKNIQVDIYNSLLYDSKMMNRLENVQCVVLVEGAGTTKYKEIQQELELLRKLDVDVLGGVIVQ